MPFIKKPIPQRIDTPQNDIAGKPTTIAKPIKNKIIEVKYLQPQKLKTFLICAIKAVEDMLSRIK